MGVLVVGPVAWNVLVAVDEFPEPRPHRIDATGDHEAVGGTSAGKALNLARLGVPVTLATVIGDDEAGRRIAAELTGNGVELLTTPSASGSERHLNLMDRHGRRLSIYLNRPEPTGPVTPPADVLAAATAVVVDLARYAQPMLRQARAAGKQIWCDLHDYDGVEPYHREYAEAADCVFVSDEGLADPLAFLRERIAAGARLAVCTHGAYGATALERGGEPIRVAAEPVREVVDTNGAGDAFFAGFLAARLAGAGLAECLRQATRAGASAVRSRQLAAADLTPDLVRASTPLS
jgi:sugar/nucleoside kinase (ribokinase family)